MLPSKFSYIILFLSNAGCSRYIQSEVNAQICRHLCHVFPLPLPCCFPDQGGINPASCKGDNGITVLQYKAVIKFLYLSTNKIFHWVFCSGGKKKVIFFFLLNSVFLLCLQFYYQSMELDPSLSPVTAAKLGKQLCTARLPSPLWALWQCLHSHGPQTTRDHPEWHCHHAGCCWPSHSPPHRFVIAQDPASSPHFVVGAGELFHTTL